MSDNTAKNIMSLIATSSPRIKDLSIKNGQLIFIQDLQRIALDFNGKRVFYNQITELATDIEREEMTSPLSGYYFVIDTAVLWYHDGVDWIPITEKPQEIIFIGVELPELGQANTVYINRTEKQISIWDDELDKYEVVSDYTQEISPSQIDALFE